MSVDSNKNPSSTSYIKFSANLPGKPERMEIADFNGDGLADILIAHQTGYKIYWNQGGNPASAFSESNTSSSGIFNGKCAALELGDFNGDGLPDFIINPENTSTWQLAINNGNKTFTRHTLSGIEAINRTTDKDDQYYTCLVHDMDGDGKSDVMITYGNFSGSSFKSFATYWCRSLGTSMEIIHKNEYVSTKYAPIANQIVLGDFTGNGKPEIRQYGYGLRMYSNTKAWRKYHVNELTANHNKLLAFTNGFGQKIEVEYAFLTEEGMYTKQNNAIYPLTDFAGPLCVVKKVITDDQEVIYKYEGGKLHTQGKGFLGFSLITKKDNKFITHSINQINTTWYIPEKTQEKLTSLDGTLMTQQDYTNRYTTVSGKRFLIQPEKETLSDRLKGITHITTYSNYEYGIPKSIKRQYGNDLTETVTTTLQNITTNGKWILGLPLTTEVKKESSNSSWLERTVNTYTHDNRIAQTSLYAGTTSNKVLTKKFNYDDFGHVIQEKEIKYSSPDELITTYEYSTDGRHVIKITDPSGLIQKHTYTSLGQLETSTDPLGNITQYEYDTVDRLKKTRYPDGTTESTYVFKDVTTLIPGETHKAAYKLTHSRTGKPNQYIYYDKLGREVKKV